MPYDTLLFLGIYADGNSGFNTPHTHPRATELAIVVKGRMISEFVAEMFARKIRNEHGTYSMVVFPQGALHLEFNPYCTEMVRWFHFTFNQRRSKSNSAFQNSTNSPLPRYS